MATSGEKPVLYQASFPGKLAEGLNIQLIQWIDVEVKGMME